MLLRARIVLPVSRPPIEDGAVAVAGQRIQTVGRWADLAAHFSSRTVDLGECVLLPGLINAHCHLDYTDLAGKIPPPRNFTDWIKGIVALKAAWSLDEFRRSWRRGATLLVRTGTTTVADVEAVPELLPDAWHATPLRVISFRELICLKDSAQAKEQFTAAVNHTTALPGSDGRVGLSPHAPYTTSAELLRLAAALARQRGWLLTTHVAESEPELQMFLYRQGPMYDWLKHQRDMSDCGLGSPVQHLDRCGYLAENLLAVHANYLWRDDALVLGRRKVSVAHCPRSHDYFRHLRFPYEVLAAAGVNVCLGTDSLASLRPLPNQPLELNMFAELGQFATAVPNAAPVAILRLATVNAAAALGQKGNLGELAPQALADLIAIPFQGASAQVHEAVVHHSGAVAASMIDGRWALAPQC
jgi:cytosine/adenosine deaminase-related metal-dependent hydrolase